jgi:GWxTD domain-containing protein
VNKIIFLMAGIFSLFIISFGFAQDSGLVTLPLEIWVDYASFQYQPDTTRSYVEVYYALNRKQLDFYEQKDGNWASVVNLALFIKDPKGDSVETRTWEIATTVKDEKEAKETEYLIIDVLGTVLLPNTYFMELQAEDLNSHRKGSAKMQMEIPSYNQKDFALSQIELAFDITLDTVSSKFIKGYRKVLPNPSDVFTQKGQMVFFYSEAYNLSTEGKDSQYTLSFSVLDSKKNQFRDLGTQTLKKPGSSAVVMSGINISAFPQGEYYLRIVAQDLENGKTAETVKSFKVLREEEVKPEKTIKEPTSPTGSAGGEEEILTEKDAKRIRNQISYIATSNELALFDQLNIEGKKELLKSFWGKRDPDPATKENEFKMEHYRRWNYVNQKFSRSSTSNDGWKTDMGRTYIKYGEPDEIEPYPSTMETKPYERWDYHKVEATTVQPSQSGVFFIFVDEDGFGVYRLVHSNATGEIQNLNWLESITTEPSLK